MDFYVVVCYSNNDTVRVIQRNKTIKPTFVLMPSLVSEDKCQFKISIEANKIPPLLTTIFQGEIWHFFFFFFAQIQSEREY